MKPMMIMMSLAVLTGCPNNPDPPDPAIDATVYADQFGDARRNATDEQLETFERGKEVALRRFTVADGLGPKYNVSFCGACHERPFLGGSAPRYRDFNIVGAKLPDGSVISTGVNGVQTQFSTVAPFRNPSDPATTFEARRNAIPFFGVGAIAAIEESEILKYADPDDADGDGISGRANYDDGFVGRFGRKSQTVSIEGFIRGPLFNHLGVTTEPLTEDRKLALPIPSPSADVEGIRSALLPCLACQSAAPSEPNFDDDDAPDPEMSQDELFDLISFAMLLGAPEPDELDEAASRGEGLFEETQCAACHVPGLRGPGGMVRLYSDLLLHDMGEDLADGVLAGLAEGDEFRTQPLWGLAATGPYLHDGRAETIEEAILLHDGESKASRELYEELSADEKSDLLQFLDALGGRDAATEGLLAPDAQLPAEGALGGSVPGIDQDRFENGRRMFDRDALVMGGLGTQFNGDSCRACHFEPDVGGAGPIGVNVVREGRIDGGTFTPPAHGTLLHRFSNTSERPEPEDGSNVFEFRQTPPMFGLGLIDTIDPDAIVANADPDDLDSDGIRGIARMVDGDRVGKFGWKLGLPTLEDFVRDAISNELGLTIAAKAGFIAGFDTDDDDVSDPELSQADYDDLVFFSVNLAPPPRNLDVDTGAGETLFTTTGCASCHVPELPTTDSQSVALFSNLLLHDVQEDGYEGIDEGELSGRLFRTTPLWGLRHTGPYWHDGFSSTIEHAIERHAAEGEESANNYAALTDAEKADLLAFLESL